ncbi:MAG: hypothetical protein ACI9GW_000691 [Halieaceae bacterium]|jgi:hypothetical protein
MNQQQTHNSVTTEVQASQCRSQAFIQPGCSVLGAVQMAPERESIERYITSVFDAAYSARILDFLPLLFALIKNDSIAATLGLRSASASQLFCERYLEETAEELVLRMSGEAVRRDHIMEMGNLAANGGVQSAWLYVLVVAGLNRAGVRWLLFAANRAVQNSIGKCNFTPLRICPADPGKLGAEAVNWGSYYDGKPDVMLGDLALTVAQAQAQPMLADLLASHESEIDYIAAAVMAYQS